MIRKYATIATVAASTVVLAACAAAPAVEAPAVPDNLRPAADQVPSLEALATGVQIYECAPSKADASRFEWNFVAPEAQLFDRTGRQIGRHYAGPTWELSGQGKVVGEVSARDDGPDAGAIPWLLLKVKAASGDGPLTRARSVQRVGTVGGKAPAPACDRAQAGNVARVPYRAVYYFYVQG